MIEIYIALAVFVTLALIASFVIKPTSKKQA